jgi:Iron-containing redox enzyme
VIAENSPSVDIPALRPKSLRDIAQKYIEAAIDDIISSLPDPARLSSDQRRGIIARYTAVLEPNFIYWMTATYLSARSAEAHQIIKDNLREEVRDNHPGMLRRFAQAARATAADADHITIGKGVVAVRAFVAQMDPLQIILMMAFFEGFIQRFMPYLAELAARQGSSEREYTDVHSVGDIAHTQGLLTAFSAELSLINEPVSRSSVLEGIAVLRNLVEAIVHS